MTDVLSAKVRRKWSTPQVRRISAGSAEATLKAGVADGGTAASGKNFS
jgi:hypothetical protein